MGYEDGYESESSQEERDTTAAVEKSTTMTLTGLTPEVLDHVICSYLERDWRLGERVNQQIDKQIEKAISKGLEESVKRLADEHVRPLIAAAAENGYQQTDTWGSPTGKKITLAERLTSYLFGNSRHDSPIERIYREELEKALRTEHGKVFQQALAGIATKVDAELNGRITNAFKQALGMK